MNHLHERIIEISKKHGLSHLGSCLTAVDIIDGIYQVKKDNEPFILSCGHAGLALYVVLEKYYGKDAEKLYLKHGTHPNADIEDGIFCSTGSLGLGITVALGYAMSDKKRMVFCLISDGEAAEGTIWEVANVIQKYDLCNLKIFCNWNGWGAYDKPAAGLRYRLSKLPVRVIDTSVQDYGFIGQEAHYVKL